MRVLVTVGSTRFDALVETTLSQPVLNVLSQKGFSDVVVQCGSSRVDELGSTDVEGIVHKYGVDVKIWRFKPSLDEEYDAADLVIGHAGSGTILDVLRRGKPLIIVPNPTLLDNHQEDMAHAMGVMGYAKVSTVNGLSQSIMDLDTSKLRWGLSYEPGLTLSAVAICLLVPSHPTKTYTVTPMPYSSEVTAAVIDDNPAVYERRHVHAVYDQIAPHFSSTRYKPWPLISKFLLSLPTGWVGLDSGTGNGKYLPLPTDHPGKIWTIGLDRSQSLLNIAKTAGSNGTIREVVRGDVLGQGWRRGAFDYAISIATIHHLATVERRVTAVKRLLESVSPRHGRVLIYVWAIEQDEFSKRVVPVPGRETGTHTDVDGESSTSGQDVFVPWSLSTGRARSEVPEIKEAARNAPETTAEVIQRYYHMFAKGELGQLVQVAAQEMGLKVVPPPPMNQVEGVGYAEGIEVVASGWERSNYYVELRRWRR